MSGIAIDLYLYEGFHHLLFKVQKIAADIFCIDNSLLGTLILRNTDIENERRGVQRPAYANKTNPKARKSISITASNGPVLNAQTQGFVSESDPTAKRDVSSLINTLANTQTKEKIHQCTFCNYQSDSLSHAKRHVELKHLPPRILHPCLTCGNSFKIKSDLKKHYIKVHKMPDHAAKAMLTPA